LQARLNAEPGRPLRLRVRLSLRGAELTDDSYAIERAELRRFVALEPIGLTMSRE